MNSQAAPTVWNDLPLDSRSAESYQRFRSATKKHFYTNWLLQTDHMTVSAPTIRFFLTTYGPSPNVYNNNSKSTQSNLGRGPRRGAVAYVVTYAVKSPLVTMARPKFAPKVFLSRRPISKPHYLPHPWTRPTCDAKRHPDPVRRFSTMHWTVASLIVRRSASEAKQEAQLPQRQRAMWM